MPIRPPRLCQNVETGGGFAFKTQILSTFENGEGEGEGEGKGTPSVGNVL